ncbi:MAG: SRPBCC family protein [Candidatus Eremiobacteraeota bacterium]|nr:SRPBCC family protein [Candidatus Eremiobacteraeota bacterium]
MNAKEIGMAEHCASVTVNAPVHQVYQLYTHFNDYPKFMTFVKEVTYLDDQRSHWVVDVVGRHEWDAINEGWLADRRIGWRSVDGLENSGEATFVPDGADRTQVTVTVRYAPPAGLFGEIGEALGAGSQFEHRLQHDLEHFATMVDQAPPGALDPTSSSYLFHGDSAAARGATTSAQDESMAMPPGDPLQSTTSATSGTAPPVPGTSPHRGDDLVG